MLTAKNCPPTQDSSPRVVAGFPVRLSDADVGTPFSEGVADLIANLQLDADAIATEVENTLARGSIGRLELGAQLRDRFDAVAINAVVSLLQRAGRVAVIGARAYAPQHATGVLHGGDGTYLVDEFENTANHFRSVFRDLSIANRGVVKRTALVALVPGNSVDRWIKAMIADGTIRKISLEKGRVGYCYKR